MPQHSVRTQPPICDMTGSGHPQVGGHHHHHHPLEGRTLRYVFELFLIIIKKTHEIKIYYNFLFENRFDDSFNNYMTLG